MDLPEECGEGGILKGLFPPPGDQALVHNIRVRCLRQAGQANMWLAEVSILSQDQQGNIIAEISSSVVRVEDCLADGYVIARICFCRGGGIPLSNPGS